MSIILAIPYYVERENVLKDCVAFNNNNLRATNMILVPCVKTQIMPDIPCQPKQERKRK